MLPYRTPVGTMIDSGHFEAVLDRALALSDFTGIATRKREAFKRGKLRGIGVSCFLEHAGGTPKESAVLKFQGNDTVVLALGLQATGQDKRRLSED